MAFTETYKFAIPVANQMLICYRLQGDASDTTWTAPLGVIDAAWIQQTTAADTPVAISFSGNVVTFTTAPAATSYFDVFVIGSA